VNRLAIREQYDSEVPLLLRDKRPPTNAPVRLDLLGIRVPDRQFNPRVQNARSIRTHPRVSKILGGLQDTPSLSGPHNSLLTCTVSYVSFCQHSKDRRNTCDSLPSCRHHFSLPRRAATRQRVLAYARSPRGLCFAGRMRPFASTIKSRHSAGLSTGGVRYHCWRPQADPATRRPHRKFHCRS